ncbi:response regulator transcription factor [Streptomyces jeddahensis]|uniref:response regulator transcription factor n=1 Tax=Streptomyces jeddahensis TaxID=1716141 RepID=UPI0022B807BA|nr:response regulator transcription factor [Streptomyces jeddahensis]
MSGSAPGPERAPESARHTVLLAEDDRAIRHALERALTLEGYDVTAVADGVEALAQAHRGRPDVLVLDVMMPGIDGLQVCRVLRAEGDRTPILMLTARVETADRIAGLDAGADDYVVKPFDVDEVFARLRALLRRTGTGTPQPGQQPQPLAPDGRPVPEAPARAVHDGQVVTVGDLRIDPPARRAWRGTRELELTRTEFDLLELLARNTGIVLDHSTIYDRIWGYDFGPGSKNLAVYVGYLRRKMDEPGLPPLIHTVRGVGYVLRED